MSKLKVTMWLAVPVIIFAAVLAAYRPPAQAVAENSAVVADLSIRAARLRSIAERSGGSVRVIVGLKTPFVAEGRLEKMRQQEQRANIKYDQERFLKRVGNSGIRNAEAFETIPYLVLETNVEGLSALVADQAVDSIEEDIVGKTGLAQSTQIVGAQAAWASGFSGNGQVVAILDTGVEKTHEFLAGKVISEACYSTTNASSTSVCPGGVTASTAVGSGVNCTVNGCAHGTNVAGIAAGRGTSFSGVAKDANLVSIQVFSRFTSETNCGTGQAPCALYWTSDVIKGLERVLALKNSGTNIAAANMSLQTNEQYAGNCDTNHAATKAAIDNLRAVGVASVVCSGNYAYTNGMTAPACISSAVSVGSVDDGSLGTTQDVVSTFSDSSPQLNLLAPGRWINSSIPGNSYQNYSGTSMAAPHVAGAYAILRQKAPNASVSQILTALSNTGTPITDTRNGLIKPRINVNAALAVIGGKSKAFDFDGDGKADISVFRPSNQNWYVQGSSTGFTVRQFGANGDRIVPADFDGDGRTELAVFRASNATWYIQGSTIGFMMRQFGDAADIPVPADFDGDGKADVAVFRPSTGMWYVQGSAGVYTVRQFGANGDTPAASDFDGDGKADIAVFRPSNQTWYIQGTSVGYSVKQFGAAGDKPVAADFDGDGKTDIAVFRPSTGTWYITKSLTGAFTYSTWGVSTDTPVPADFDGDGNADLAVFRASTGEWYVWRSTGGMTTIPFGVSTDTPTPAR